MKRPSHAQIRHYAIKMPWRRFFYSLKLVVIFCISVTIVLALKTEGFAQSTQTHLQIDGAVSHKTLNAQTVYFVDESQSLSFSDILKRNQDGAFQPAKALHQDIGYSENRVWLSFKVQNKTEHIDEWLLYTHENFLKYYDVYLVRAQGEVEHLESHNSKTRYSERSIAYPELITQLQIMPDETAQVFVSFVTDGSPDLHISLETLQSFTDHSNRHIAKIYISYGMFIILIVAACVAFAIFRLSIWAYFLYAISAFLFLMHADGIGFAYLWPNVPQFNNNASLFFGGGFSVACALYTRQFLETYKYRPVLDKALLTSIILGVLIILACAFIEPYIVKRALIFVGLLTILLCLFAGVLDIKKRFKLVRFYVFAWIGAALALGLMNLRSTFGFEVSRDFEFDTVRLAMVFDAAMLGLAIADRFNQLRKDRVKSITENLASTQRNLELNIRLNNLDEQYRQTAEKLESQENQLNNKVHDLRQPLHALRLKVQNLQNTSVPNESDAGKIEESFEYLEALLSDTLEAAKTDENKKTDLDSVLSKVRDMFKADANERGLDLKYVKTSKTTDVPSLAILRIVTNLVSNAIKYTANGKVLFGVRAVKEGLRIEVHDTGIGMSEVEFQTAIKQNTRLQSGEEIADGFGRGLAIVAEQVDAHGLTLRRLNRPKNAGSSLVLEIPQLSAK